eukprot:TRINITY_DN1952_c0_g3_i2.p1 TRINITY_DN1952_c0_g3~~TRINITY_DN1952_c0_g3_i2.p1  ORF type:complete len:257 (-),score=62.24 TRINITY_DN1952_c0_g3_i2:131-901(-)
MMNHNNLFENASFVLKTQETMIADAQKEAYTQPVSGPSKRTTDPINTGTSVLGIKYAGGVMIAADTLISYGSLARFRNISRLANVGKYTVIGATGEYSDFQNIKVLLDELLTEDFCHDDGHSLSPKEIHSYLSRVMYNRRNRFNPYYNQLVVGGVKGGKSFLGYVDLVGTTFEENYIASGYGSYLALPLIRKAWKEDLTEEEAKKLLEDCLKVLFYRDARSLNKIQIAKIDATGWSISAPYSLPTQWEYGVQHQIE